ncbi:heterogeneous nuclear ribonucleoprotein K isoform X4 [Halyomorpha halys]|uniref:heterogeneous nuclear ribonucleoprotein K isoform X4 n=1 Tax=Halyomorpha halys TaxID=286706 RepID=UPI0006D51C64|nr:heterogeneous nuclear ribonucleoprotein K isoform X3 [Halyomorpha halys]
MPRNIMKRNSDMKSERGGLKRSRQSEEPSLRLLIPSKVAGSIIGKGGKNISRIRSDFNATVQVPDCSGPERVVSITADQETSLNILGEIIPCLDEFFSSSKNEVDVRLLVHQSLAGCVIGKGGAKVKELREKTSAKIKIFGNCCPQSTDRVVSVVGSPEVALNGVREILALLKDTPQKGYSELYDPSNFDEEFAEDYGGFGSGRISGGRPIWEGGAPGRFPPPPPPPPSVPFRRGDLPDQTQVTIPKDLAGAIIGKGGSRIRKVRSDSGAEITIDEPLPGSNDRIITIKGNPDQIQLAQYLLQQAVRESRGSTKPLSKEIFTSGFLGPLFSRLAQLHGIMS